jgi:hypothetical protein
MPLSQNISATKLAQKQQNSATQRTAQRTTTNDGQIDGQHCCRENEGQHMRLLGYSQETRRPSQTRRLSDNVFLASAEIFLPSSQNKDAILKQLKGLQLSDSTITRRIEDIW